MRSLAYLMVRSAPFETPPAAAPQDKLARLEPRTTELQPIRNPPSTGVNLAECACAIPPCNPVHQPPPRSLSNRLRKVGRGSGGWGGTAGTPTCAAVHLSSCSRAPSSASVAAMSMPSRPGHSYGLGEQAASGLRRSARLG